MRRSSAAVIIRTGLLLLLVLATVTAQAQRLWILEAPDQMVEYDPFTFARTSAHIVPRQALQFPGDLQVNRAGQMLFAPAMIRESDGLTHPASSPSVWFWNGKIAVPVMRAVREKVEPAGPNVLVESSTPRPALSADGSRIFWFDNSRKTLQHSDRSVDIATSTTFRAWQTDLMGIMPHPLANWALPECKCETGVCSESCPEADVHWPKEGVSDAFVVTQWVPGQVGSDYQASFLYRQAAGKWTNTKLAHPMEQVLDFVVDSADVLLLEAVLDAGCCGWMNASSDQLILNRGAKSVTLFDERHDYNNANYDISFFVSRAKLSPNQRLVAMTVQATQKLTEELRLADEGKDNPAELAQLKKILPDMPMVRVTQPGDAIKTLTTVPRAAFIGWLNDSELLMVENGVIVAFDVVTQRRRQSTIKVAQDAYAFLR